VQRLLQGRRQGDQAADRVSCRRAPQLALSPAPIWHDSGRRRCAAAGGHTPRAPRARTQGSRYTSRRPSSRPRARVHGTEMRSPFTAVADASAVLRLAVPARRTSLRSSRFKVFLRRRACAPGRGHSPQISVSTFSDHCGCWKSTSKTENRPKLRFNCANFGPVWTC
jgi:hypothetical protein